MFIVETIPLTLLPPNVPQILSYFSNVDLPKGSIVEVGINKRKVNAVVISSDSIEKAKLALKKVDFQIKKINKVICDKPQVSEYQLKIASWIAKRYYAPLGYTLKTILPPFSFKKKFPRNINNQLTHTTTRRVVNPQLWVYKTRGLVNHLELLIKKIGDKQILILVPEKTTIDYFSGYFAKKYGISVVFSGMSNKDLYDTWTKVQSDQTQIIIGTRQALNMQFKNLGLIILDDPLHEFYKSDMVPRYNAVALAYKVAELNNAHLVLTSVVPGLENYHNFGNQILNLEPRPKVTTEIVDMAQEIKNSNWSSISKKLGDDILECVKNNKKVLIFSPRRGYVGVVICENCGSAIKCPQCDVAMRTHRSVEMILVCHHCEVSKPIPQNCPLCTSHRLKTIGPAGTQKIYEEIRSKVLSATLKVPILVLDSDVVKNETEEDEIVNEIKKPGPAILIATQMVFSHRFNLKFDLIGIVNADALMNMPDFRSEENLFYQIEKLVNFSPEKLITQTYNPENKIIEQAVQGEYETFYKTELKFREALNYPPFYKLIKLTFKHKHRDKASYAARVATEKLKMAIARAKFGELVKLIEATPAYIEKEKGLYIYNIFLKVKSDYQNFGDLLKYLDPGWIIDVEPRSLL